MLQLFIAQYAFHFSSLHATYGGKCAVDLVEQYCNVMEIKLAWEIVNSVLFVSCHLLWVLRNEMV